MTPTFMGQAVLGAASALSCSNGGSTLAVSGVLAGTSSGAVTTAQNALKALALDNGGGAGPLIVPTGFSAVPSAQTTPITASAAVGATSLAVQSTAGLAAGQWVILMSALRPGIMERVQITAITNATTLAVAATTYNYQANDLVAAGPLCPWASLFPSGANAAMPPGENYPGWDRWTAEFALSDATFGSITGGGSAYQCTFTVNFHPVGGPNSY